MAKKRADDLDPLDRLFAALDDAPPGLHDVDPVADELPPGLPPARIELVLLGQGATIDARNELEQVVADDPAFAWAWLDLARVSEKLGEVGGAIDEARMAAEAAEGMQHAQAGYFWSQVARLAVRAG